MTRGTLRIFIALQIFSALLPCQPAHGVLGVRFWRWVSPTDPNEFYTLAKVSPHWEAVDRTNNEVARALIRAAEDWVLGQFRRSYPDLPSEVFDRLAREAPVDDGRTEFYVVMNREDATKIHGTLAIAARTSTEPALPVEVALGTALPEPRFEVDRYPYYPETKDPSVVKRGAERIYGAQVEIRRLALAPDAPRDFLPILYEFSSPESLHSPGKWPEALFPNEYVLQCDPRMEDYYAKLGFRRIEGRPPPDGGDLPGPLRSVAMSIDRMRYFEIWKNSFRARPGAPLAYDWKIIPDPPALPNPNQRRLTKDQRAIADWTFEALRHLGLRPVKGFRARCLSEKFGTKIRVND